MIKNKIIIFFTIIISLLSFSESSGIKYESDEFDNATYIYLNTLNYDNVYTDELFISLLGSNNKLNAKCWINVFSEFKIFSEYETEILTASMSIDGKIYDDMLDSDKFLDALKKIKSTSKVRFRIIDEYNERTTFELGKTEVKHIYDFFNKKCK